MDRTAGLGALLLTAVAGVAWAKTFTCAAGSTEQDPCTGTKKGDSITGTDGNDVAFGGGGGDYLRGWHGNDRLYGGKGNDPIDGNTGNDYIYGVPGDDRIEENDLFQDAPDDCDTVYGGPDNDTIVV